MGCYHGRHTFNQLSHLRSCLIKKLNMEGVNSMRYPPHTAKKTSWARFFLLKQINVGRVRRVALFTMFVGLAAFVIQVTTIQPICRREGHIIQGGFKGRFIKGSGTLLATGASTGQFSSSKRTVSYYFVNPLAFGSIREAHFPKGGAKRCVYWTRENPPSRKREDSCFPPTEENHSRSLSFTLVTTV